MHGLVGAIQCTHQHRRSIDPFMRACMCVCECACVRMCVNVSSYAYALPSISLRARTLMCVCVCMQPGLRNLSLSLSLSLSVCVCVCVCVCVTMQVLEESGPAWFAKAMREEKRTLLTDTTWRDAHQSLFATRLRTYDILQVGGSLRFLAVSN